MEMIRCKCVDCGGEYVLEDEDVQFYHSKNLTLPKRCPFCRKLKRLKKELEAKNGREV
jgi:hypothetical protein